MRRFLHGFFALAVLLGSIGAEPSVFAIVAPHQDCCCGDESQCPCDLPRAPQGPRCPGGCPNLASQVSLPAVAKPQAESQKRIEPLPWEGCGSVAWAGSEAGDNRASALPGEVSRPPDRSLRRLALIGTFRI